MAAPVPGIGLKNPLIYYCQDDLRSVIVPFESVVPDVPDSHRARQLRRNNREAEANLRQGLRLDPGLGSSHCPLARVYHSERKYAQALAKIDAAEIDR